MDEAPAGSVGREPSVEDLGISAARRRERFGLLLLAIMASFALQGIATPGKVEQVVVALLLATTLVLAMRAAQARPSVIRASIAIGAFVVVAAIVESLAGDVEGWAYRLANLLLVTLAPPAIGLGVVRGLRARQGVTVEAVFGVLCIYLLIGMAFAFIYGAIYKFSGSFFASGVPADVAHCLYFSFTTLTTVGYGDYVASSNLGHTLSVSEALVGQIYLVTVVSIMVGNLSRNRGRAT